MLLRQTLNGRLESDTTGAQTARVVKRLLLAISHRHIDNMIISIVRSRHQA